MELVQAKDIEESQAPKQNIEALLLHYYSDHYMLESKLTSLKYNLFISRDSGDHHLQSKTSVKAADKTRPFSCYMGTIQIFSSLFLLLVDEVRLACTLEGHNIFEIMKVSFVPIKEELDLGKDYRWPQICHFLSSVRKLLSCGFYFCYTMDLTLSRQAYANGQKTDEVFCWNNYLSRCIQGDQFQEWFIPVIQGFVKQTQSYITGKKVITTLISRRAWQQGGTRFYSRGINDQGSVANFVETEMIVSHGGKLCSHVQIRGSVPCFWRQSGHIQIEIELTRREEPTRQAFLKHTEDLLRRYQRIFCLNLLSKDKPQEQMLTNIYEGLIRNSAFKDSLKYEFFDFHAVTKGVHFPIVNSLVQKLAPLSKEFGFYLQNQDKTVERLQTGVMRINCLDCLDRTNFCQTKIAANMLQSILATLLPPSVAPIRLLSAIDDSDQTDSLTVNQREMWADNGDMISYHYTGAESTHAQIIRGGGGLRSVWYRGKASLIRFYMQNFEDGDKQDAIHLILGTHLDTANLNQLKQWRQLNLIEV